MIDGDRCYGKVESEEGTGMPGWACCFTQGVRGGLEEKVTCDSRPEEGVSVRSSGGIRLSSHITPKSPWHRDAFSAETSAPCRSAGDLQPHISCSSQQRKRCWLTWKTEKEFQKVSHHQVKVLP